MRTVRTVLIASTLAACVSAIESSAATEHIAVESALADRVASVIVEPESLDLEVADNASARCRPVNQYGSPLANTCSWVSRSTGVATVAGSGQLVTITARGAGTTWVVATVKGKRDSLRVSVITAPPLPDTTPPPPPPPPPVAGCTAKGLLRLVNVSTSAQFTTALGSALPGDCIKMAAGNYAMTTYSMTRSGTATNPITIEGAWGAVGGTPQPTSVIRLASNSAIYVRANYVHWRKVRNTGGFWAFRHEGASFAVLDSVQTDSTRQEQVSFHYSPNFTVRRSRFFVSGMSNIQFGEGLYIGGYAESGPPTPDAITANGTIIDNNFGPGLTAEAIDLSGGVSNMTVERNNISGVGTIFQPGAMSSLIGVRGTGHVFNDNVLVRGAPNGIEHWEGTATYHRNSIDLQDYPSFTGEHGIRRLGGTATIYCDNTVTSIPSGGVAYNVTCTP